MMYERGGFMWPNEYWEHIDVILKQSKSIDAFLEHVPGRRLAFQAGGNVGVYPKRLAESFETVVTAEPDIDNLQCLVSNTAGIANITSYWAALGNQTKMVELIRHTTNCGMHRVGEDIGSIPMLRVDDFQLPECDLIWFDIEGYEALALEGAEKTVETFWPVVIIERSKGAGSEPHAARWLEKRGYEQVAKIRHDALFRRPL